MVEGQLFSMKNSQLGVDHDAGVQGIDQVVVNRLQIDQVWLQDFLELADPGDIPGSVDFVFDDFAEVISSLKQEIDCGTNVGGCRVNRSSIHKGCLNEAFFALVEANLHPDVPALIESLLPTLQHLECLQQLGSCYFEGLDIVFKGEHVVVMLVLDDPRQPDVSEPAGVHDDKISGWDCVVHQASEEIGDRGFLIFHFCEFHIALDQLLQVYLHFGLPLLVEKRIELGMSVDGLAMKLPIDQVASRFQLLTLDIVAPACVLEYLLAYWDRALDRTINDLSIVIEFQVKRVKVVTSIDCSHVGDSVDEMMSDTMTVSLDHSIDSPLRQ